MKVILVQCFVSLSQVVMFHTDWCPPASLSKDGRKLFIQYRKRLWTCVHKSVDWLFECSDNYLL